ncbi:FemAB family XrtA/PEP-CTERM system-associated protein [Mucisphaera sp.]|uniref:FemAB family XrtA/PEP-CTERM system-associated protein n=1 Tax=Mucisphaera sp. TaxID=2913024 RepID=UPI003D0EB6E3
MPHLQTHHVPSPSLAEEALNYLRTQPNAAPETHPAWLTALRQGLGHTPILLTARPTPTANLTGLLPLAWVRSRLFGRFLVSLPYLNRAGVIAADPDTAHALISHAAKLARDGRADYLELRHAQQPIPHDDLTETRADKPRLLLELPDTTEALWDGFKAKVRNQIRKAERFNPQLTFARHENLDAFYDIFATTMRDLGTPVYPKRFFAAILQNLPEHAEIALLTINQTPAAAALLVHDPVHHQTTQVPSAACLRSANPMNANMALYHGLLNRAIQRGAARFDFGRSSPNAGTYRFKTQWGAQPEPTYWQQFPLHGSTHAARPDNPRYRKRIETWQKLPVWLTRIIGPPIVRGIP